MAIGTVKELGESQNGNPKVKIDNIWYSAGRCDITGIQVGQRIEYQFNEFGNPGRNGHKPRGLQEWRPAGNGSHAPSTPTNLEDADRPFISNVVAHAIEAKLIQKPEEMEVWAIFAQRTLDALKAGKHKVGQPRPAPAQAPDFDDQIPSEAYDNDPPPKRQW